MAINQGQETETIQKDVTIIGNLTVIGDTTSSTTMKLATLTEESRIVGEAVTQTVDQLLSDMASDGVLVPTEKQELNRTWNQIYTEKPRLLLLADAQGFTTGNAYYDAVVTEYSDLYTYLFTTPGVLIDLTTTTTVVSADLLAAFNSYWLAKTNLIAFLGTQTPSAPSFTIYAQGKNVYFHVTKQTALTNFGHYEVTVSLDNSAWYSLKFDGTAVTTGTLNGDTDFYSEDFAHTNIPYGGTTSLPTGVLLYYKVRQVTKAVTPLVGDWSAAQSVTTGTIAAGDLTALLITAAKMNIGVFNDNLVLNPGAEDGVNGWALAVGSGTLTASSSDKSEGSYSFLLPAPTVATVCRAIPVNPGDTYAYRLKIKGTSSSATGLYVQLREKTTYPAGDYITNALETSETQVVANGSVPSIWTEYSGTYTVPAGIYWVSLGVMNWTGGPAGGIYFDEVELRKQIEGVHIKDGVITAVKIATGILTADKVAATFIQAVMLAAATIAVGYAGTGTIDDPDEGDTRVYLATNSISWQIYANGAWSTIRRIKIGGADANGNFIPYMQAHGLLNLETDNPELSVDPIPDWTYKLYRWNNVQTDQDGIDPWTIVAGSFAYSTTHWEGTHSLALVTSNVSIKIEDVWTIGSDVTLSMMFRVDAEYGSSFNTLLGWHSGADDYILLAYHNGQHQFQYYIKKDGTSSSGNLGGTLSTATWYHVGLTYKASANKLYLVRDEVIIEATPSGSWGSGTGFFEVFFAPTGTESFKIDDLLVSHDKSIDHELLYQHQNRGKPWGTDFTQKDLVLVPQSGGHVIHGPIVANEPSQGMYHPCNRTVTGWDLSARTETLASPYTWDLSSLIPVGTNMVRVNLAGSLAGTSEILASSISAWDYDHGVDSYANEDFFGMTVRTPYKPATVGSQTSQASRVQDIKIGPSRKLYVGRLDVQTTFYALLLGYVT